ncbi:MAG: DUF5777 family beta-barrel protein [Pyrinomonadaceae bacterium]
MTICVVSTAIGQEPVATNVTKTAEPATTSPTPSAALVEKDVKPLTSVKVSFETGESGVAIVEVNGERIKIDTVRRTVENLTVLQSAANNPPVAESPASPKKDAEEKKTDLDFQKGYEPYDYRVVNVPTPKHVPKGSWNLAFTHRFTQQLDPLSSSARSLFGLDSFGVASFGVSYGITDKLYASAYRSPLCQRGLCRVIEVGLGYNWIAQDKDHPVGVSTYASVEGNDNFTEEYTYNIQTMVSGRIGKRVYLFFSPAVHFNSNGQRRFDPRANDFFPPATVANSFRLPVNGATFGFGTSVMITRNVVALFDFAVRTGFKLGRVVPILDSNFRVTGFRTESHPTMGFGIQRNVGEHSFALTFSNTQTTTTSRYNSSNLVLSPKRIIIGFNLSRRF